MTDIHCHILPKIDDGSQKIEETINMLNKASSEGIEIIVATPHLYRGISQTIIYKCNSFTNELQNIAIKKKIDINIKSGFECYIVPEYGEKSINLTEITLNKNGRYILTEFPMQGIPIYAKKVFESMLNRGITPIIAHPERNFAIIKDPNILIEFIGDGCITQLNAGSILGYYGNNIRETAQILLSHKMIHLVASDMHNTSSPSLIDAFSSIERIIGIDDARRMFNEVPKKVVDGEDFGKNDPIYYEPSKKGIKESLVEWIKGKR